MRDLPLDPDPLTLAPEGVILYGPPRSRLKRLTNRLRRLVGRDERLEVTWYGTPSADSLARMRITWTADGTFRVEDDDGER